MLLGILFEMVKKMKYRKKKCKNFRYGESNPGLHGESVM